MHANDTLRGRAAFVFADPDQPHSWTAAPWQALVEATAHAWRARISS